MISSEAASSSYRVKLCCGAQATVSPSNDIDIPWEMAIQIKRVAIIKCNVLPRQDTPQIAIHRTLIMKQHHETAENFERKRRD